MLNALKQYFLAQIQSDKPTLWKKLFLLRKVYLSQYWRCYFSQFGEDIILKDWIPKDFQKGFYVDVGCYHPKKFSNTYFLYKRGWRGINIDLDTLKIDAFNLARPDDTNIAMAVSDTTQRVTVFNDGLYGLGSTIDKTTVRQTQKSNNPSVSFSKQVPTDTLDNIIEKTTYKNRQIDLLSIDAEGHDFNVLKSLNLNRYQPKMIIIESHFRDFNKILSSDIYCYLTEQGYRFSNWVGFSLFFILPKNNMIKFQVD